MLEAFDFKSINPGKSILITGAVHGNEVCGSIACKNIISKIKSGNINIKSGSVTFIPVSNPKAYAINKRFFEINLNRVIKKSKSPKLYEEKISNILTDYIKFNDYHLDLHSMHENGTPFVFQDYEEEAEFARILGLEYIFIGWPNVYKNSKTVKDYSTQHYAHTVKTINCTVECGSHTDPKAVEIAELCILRSLSYLGIIDYNETNNLKQKFIEMKDVHFKESEGKFAKNFVDLDIVKKGEIIAIYNNGKKIIADNDCYIILPNKNANLNEEWFYSGILK